MSKKDKAPVEAPEAVEVEGVVEEVVSSKEAYNAFKELIARYAEQNPEKYVTKKEALEEKLKSLK